MKDSSNIINSLAQSKYPWGIIINSRFVKIVSSSPTSGAIPVMMKQRIHLFPFRTQKLSSALPKVLSHPRLGRIGNCRISLKNDRFQAENGHFSFVLARFRFSQFVQFLLVLI